MYYERGNRVMNKEIKNLVSYSLNLGALDEHMAATVVHDAILKYQGNLKLIRTSVYFLTKEYRREQFKIYNRQHDNPDDHQQYLENLVDHSYVDAEKERDQRQLISSLISNADELTTAIVRTWLTSDKPTLTSVGRDLGINHNTVRRKLRRLAENFSEEIHGNLFEYLSA